MLDQIAQEIRNLNTLDVGFGLVTGRRRISALGNNPDVDTGASEDIWSGGGLYPFLTAQTALEIVSSSINDTANGTGARTVNINGLDGNYSEVVQTVTLNGVGSVAMPTPLLAINYVSVVTTGSDKVNAGTITIRDSGAGSTRCVMSNGYGVARQSNFTVPRGHSLAEVSLLASINRTVSGASVRYATIAAVLRSASGSYTIPLEFCVSSNNPFVMNGLLGIVVEERDTLTFRCMSVSDNNTDITVSWAGVLRKL